jgi:hypothetical protein
MPTGERMQLKAADDKQPQLEALEGLLARSDLDPRTRKQVTDELWSIRTGERTERDARFEIERSFGKAATTSRSTICGSTSRVTSRRSIT